MPEKTLTAMTFQKHVTTSEISIVINRPVETVFAAVINPSFAHLWLPVECEEKNEPTVRVGTMYRDRLNNDGAWSYYTVTDIQEPSLIEFAKLGSARGDGFYCTPIGDGVTNFTYREHNPDGIPEPATVAMLEKFKRVVEGA
jgi:uncharacterized protein YndB with AHSA1/START domain